MNAKIGHDTLNRERVTGKHGLVNINENRDLLEDFCGYDDLVNGETLNTEHQGDVPIIEQFVMELDIDIGEVSRNEIRKAIVKLKNGKSPGLDGIPAEMVKTDIEISKSMFHELFIHIWRHDIIPNDWAKGLIIKLLKKGDRCDCNNRRGITMLSVTSKILLRELLIRINDSIYEILTKEQAGF
ncbi:uncharacterized protein LOC134684793 [Mytilus trossulus]|uniref:uncharacterized protein LOC134684793 n=1 Tax=Mytilus trossulus TaxID=6551 RepID=UPI003005826D